MFSRIIIVVGLLIISSFASAEVNLKFGKFESHLELSDWSMSRQEKVWHGLNVMDMFQTINGPSQDPCYYEANPMTQNIIGKKPSVEDVILVSLAYSVGMHYFSKLIENSNMPKWSKNVTFSLTIGSKLHTVYNNHDMGVRMYGENHPGSWCQRN